MQAQSWWHRAGRKVVIMAPILLSILCPDQSSFCIRVVYFLNVCLFFLMSRMGYAVKRQIHTFSFSVFHFKKRWDYVSTRAKEEILYSGNNLPVVEVSVKDDFPTGYILFGSESLFVFKQSAALTASPEHRGQVQTWGPYSNTKYVCPKAWAPYWIQSWHLHAAVWRLCNDTQQNPHTAAPRLWQGWWIKGESGKYKSVNGITWNSQKPLTWSSLWSQASGCDFFLTKVIMTLCHSFLSIFGNRGDQPHPTLKWAQENIQLLFSRGISDPALPWAPLMFQMIGHLQGRSVLMGRILVGWGLPCTGTNLASWS